MRQVPEAVTQLWPAIGSAGRHYVASTCSGRRSSARPAEYWAVGRWVSVASTLRPVKANGELENQSPSSLLEPRCVNSCQLARRTARTFWLLGRVSSCSQDVERFDVVLLLLVTLASITVLIPSLSFRFSFFLYVYWGRLAPWLLLLGWAFFWMSVPQNAFLTSRQDGPGTCSCGRTR